MTRDEILNMPAGREMDAILMEKLFEYSWDSSFKGGAWRHADGSCYLQQLLPRFSTDIAAAWEVVEKLCDETGCDIVKVCKRDPELLRGDWSCNFGRGFEAFGETAPLAICRAALLAVMEAS